MILAFFLPFSLQFFAQNQTILSNLVIKNDYSHSPYLSFSPHSYQNFAFLANIRYSHSYATFLSVFSKTSIMLKESAFRQITNTAVKASLYKEPDLKNTIYDSPLTNLSDYQRSNITILSCVFMSINNGPGIISIGISLRLYSCTFQTLGNPNPLQLEGGGVHINKADYLLVNDCDFEFCESKNRGGGFFCSDCRLVVHRTAFRNCKSFDRGGGFFYIDSNHADDIIVKSCSFEECAGYSNTSYFEITYKNSPDKTMVLMFVRFDCTKETETYYYTIKTNPPSDPVIVRFRNEYNMKKVNVHMPPTATFSPTGTFSNTPVFTLSNSFTQSLLFSPSNDFSESFIFSNSGTFLPTQPFSSSSQFTPSSFFTPTISFSLSDSFSQSSEFPLIPPTPPRTPTDIPTSPYFSSSESFSESTNFTPSQSFTPPATIAATNPPAIKWPNLSLGLLIFFGIILLAGIIINIYLCCLCCKPTEIFAQQYV